MKVLLVEDSNDVRDITVEYLQELGHEVVDVVSGELALAALQQQGKFDVVMTDFRLPGMTGIQLATQLAGEFPELPVIIASGYGALAAQAVPKNQLHKVIILPKPYDLAELENTLTRASSLSLQH
jgi:DNA-binding NtrC family response regulator